MKKSIDQLLADRQAAGVRYAAAAQAYVEAYVELHAHDLAVANAAVSRPASGACAPFVPPPGHGEFLRDPLHTRWAERVVERHHTILRSLDL